MRPFGLEHFAKVFVNRVMVHGLVLPDLSGDIDFQRTYFRGIFSAHLSFCLVNGRLHSQPSPLRFK